MSLLNVNVIPFIDYIPKILHHNNKQILVKPFPGCDFLLFEKIVTYSQRLYILGLLP